MKLFGKSSPQNLEFKQWVKMAQDDPELFERLRLEAINEAIEDAPESHQQRLRCLQWRIDQERRKASNPLSACVRISRMMWESVSGQGGLLENLNQIQAVVAGRKTAFAEPAPKAEVLAFRPGTNR